MVEYLLTRGRSTNEHGGRPASVAAQPRSNSHAALAQAAVENNEPIGAELSKAASTKPASPFAIFAIFTGLAFMIICIGLVRLPTLCTTALLLSHLLTRIPTLPAGSIDCCHCHSQNHIRVPLAARRGLVRLRLSHGHLLPAALLWQALRPVSGQVGVSVRSRHLRGRVSHLRGGTQLRRADCRPGRRGSRLRRPVFRGLYRKFGMLGWLFLSSLSQTEFRMLTLGKADSSLYPG